MSYARDEERRGFDDEGKIPGIVVPMSWLFDWLYRLAFGR